MVIRRMWNWFKDRQIDQVDIIAKNGSKYLQSIDFWQTCQCKSMREIKVFLLADTRRIR